MTIVEAHDFDMRDNDVSSFSVSDFGAVIAHFSNSYTGFGVALGRRETRSVQMEY